MRNWIECQQGFWIPNTIDCAQFAPFDDLVAKLTDAPELEDIIIVGDAFRPPGWAWARWQTAFDNDRAPRLGTTLEEAIARRKYESARFIALVPAWRRTMIDWLTEIDDIEDQLSTVLIILEWISKKVIPLPKSILAGADDVRRQLDRAERLLAGVPLNRSAKSEWHASQREAMDAKRQGRRGVAKLLDFMKANWGKILEAAQATKTWFDVGLVLGPLIGFIEEGAWGLARKTVDNYLVAVDALLPGYSDEFNRVAGEYSDAIDNAIDIVWSGVTDNPDAYIDALVGAGPYTTPQPEALQYPSDTTLTFP